MFFSAILVLFIGVLHYSESALTQVPGDAGGKRYAIIDSQSDNNWVAAHYRCKIEGYELATIESYDETYFLLNYFRSTLGDDTLGPDLWTSGSTLGSPVPNSAINLKWSSNGKGIVEVYTNWRFRNEPALDFPFSFKKCVGAGYNSKPGASGDKDFNWQIFDCTIAMGALCQSMSK